MTTEEALIYLPIDDPEDLMDMYELKLFEFKQFLTSNFPVTKVFQSKAKKIELIDQAYVALGGEVADEGVEAFSLNTTNGFFKAFSDFGVERNRLKKEIMNATSGARINRLITAYLGLVRKYARLWQKEYDTEGVIVSKEPNGMEMHEAIKAYQIEGKESFEEMEKFQEAKKLLIAESKRLSLWLKLDSNV